MGRVPDDAYLHSPTPWSDLYKTYGWQETETVLRPISAEILGVTTDSVALKSQIFENDSDQSAQFDVSISDTVSNTVTNTWQTGGSLTFDQKIKYEVGFLGTGGGGETGLSISQSWGVGGSSSKSQSFGSTSGVTVTLKPHQSVKSVLSATRGVMKIRIQYKASLTGQAAVNYGSTFKGHHFWGPWIQNVMESVNNPNSVQSTEDIDVGYFSNGKITLQDIKTSEILGTFSVY